MNPTALRNKIGLDGVRLLSWNLICFHQGIYLKRTFWVSGALLETVSPSQAAAFLLKDRY